MNEQNESCALTVSPALSQFAESELLPAIGIKPDDFWSGLESIVDDLTPVNRALLDKRDEMQAEIDAWHQERLGQGWDQEEYVAFLQNIGYLVPTGEPFSIETENVDREIAEVAGPQLVVPVSNARFAINAANARWGSLYDALYGTDAISEDNGQQRERQVQSRARGRGHSLRDRVSRYRHSARRREPCRRQCLWARPRDDGDIFVASLANGDAVGLADPAKFAGHTVEAGRCVYLFRNHGLHIELLVDPEHPVGKDATANLADVVLESAVTTIQDCEDSVAAVDAEDKVGVYRNWLGLMQADLEATIEKGGKMMCVHSNAIALHDTANGEAIALSGRSLLLVRNVGHLMTTDAVLDANGDEVFEGILDAVITTACAMTDRRRENLQANSRAGSIYIVKPKMHGPHEVAFADTLVRPSRGTCSSSSRIRSRSA